MGQGVLSRQGGSREAADVNDREMIEGLYVAREVLSQTGGTIVPPTWADYCEEVGVWLLRG